MSALLTKMNNPEMPNPSANCDREQTLSELLKTKERFELALAGASDGLWDWDLTTDEIYFSPRWKGMLGYEDHEVGATLEEWSQRVHPDDLQRAINVVTAYLDGKLERYQVEFRMRHKQGHYVHILSRGQLIKDGGGRPRRFVGTHVDVSERVNAETRFRTMFESSRDAVMLLDEYGFFDCNPATLDIFGIADRELFCRYHPVDLSPQFQPDGRLSTEAVQAHIHRAMTHGGDFFEWVHKRGNGEAFIADVSLACMEFQGKRVLQATVRDISERKNAEILLEVRYQELQQANQKIKEAQAQLLQAEKMASIGQLAAGIAHEINNPIAYVNSNMGALSDYIGDIFQLLDAYEAMTPGVAGENAATQRVADLKHRLDIGFVKSDIIDLIEETRGGLGRVKDIVQNLKDFSRTGDTSWEVADVHKGMESTLNIVHNELKYKVDVIRDYGEIPEIECIPSQLNQVFMNLLVNAGHAIEDSGQIFIRSGRQDDDFIWIEIADTGSGIPRAIQNRIFEPFFTTKEVGKGTGLGLSIVYGIIEQHKGQITLASKQGQGTTFRLVLPVGQQ